MSSDLSSPSVDVARDSEVPISTQIYWQIAYQIDSEQLQAGAKLPAVRELAVALRVNPNTIHGVYRRLAEAGYVSARQGAGTHVADRRAHRQGSGALAAIVSEMMRRATLAGFGPDELAAAAYAAAAERRHAGSRVRVLFAECTPADARLHAARLSEVLADVADVDGVLLSELESRLSKFHYDVVATSAFHGNEAQGRVAGRAPVIAMLATLSYVDLMRDLTSLPPGATVGLVNASRLGAVSMASTLASNADNSIRFLEAALGEDEALARIDREADLILLSKAAQEFGVGESFQQPERIRSWSYEIDSSGLELLRRAVADVQRKQVALHGAVSAVPANTA